MEDSNALNPQVPGQTPGVDANALAPLLLLPLVDLVSGLSALTDAEVEELRSLEAAGENRLDFIDALETEQMRRLEDAPMPTSPVVAENAPAPLGDLASYAHLPASAIDPTQLQRAVLSKDGWVLPSPSARGE